MAKRLTNCVNCGAILHGDKCEYCGTRYKGNSISVELDDQGVYGKLTIKGKSFDVYLTRVNIDFIEEWCGRDMDGRIRYYSGEPKRTFTLVEV